MENRLKVLSLLFALFAIVLVGRLFYWQVIKASSLAQRARFQHESGSAILASRGNIVAHDGTWLAASQEAWLLVASKPDIKDDIFKISTLLAPYFVEADADKNQLADEVNRIRGLLDKNQGMWIPIKHKLTTQKKKEIEKLELSGITFEKEEIRKYPEASSAAQLLGFVGKNDDGDDKGYFGLEGYYDLTLSGKNGFVSRESDALGAPIVFGDSKEIKAAQGVDLVTYVDKRIQMVLEQRLKEGIEKYGAKSGSAVAMDPTSGGILAMASYPSYDPAKYYDFGDEFFKNPVISDAFEPGSIFKPIVMSAGLDAGVITPDTVCDICQGPVKVDKYSIETWNNHYFPNSTMTDVIVHSDNVGMTFVGGKLGMDKLYDYITKFGFGKLTNIDLQGEASPKLREKGNWNIVDQATATFGQGIAVTPIQMLKAIGIIANHGKNVQPKVVEKIKVGDWAEDIKTQSDEQIISQKAASQMTQMMVSAVQNGEAKWAAPKGFTIAGKTGTAQIPVAGHYDPTKTNASFVGFAPADNPRFVMLITLVEPSTSPWAAETAAPLWFGIAKELFPYLGIQQDR
jgi:stage V sporulation protein D (sporulation-specific penicillin-binding protein)